MPRRPIASLLLCVLVGCSGPAGTDPDPNPDEPRSTTVRIATWNVFLLGQPGSVAYEAARGVLARIDADLVALNELAEEDREPFAILAQDLGYDTAFLPLDNPFGEWRNAVMTRLPVRTIAAPTASSLAREDRANDLTRLPIVTTVDLPEIDGSLTVVGQHLKSGFETADRFRRAVDAHRTAQAAALPGPLLVVGDLNADADDMPEDPPVWTSPPSGLPPSYRLGADIAGQIGRGLANDAFAPFIERDLTPIYATQVDGRVATRPVSGRRIDWILASNDLVDGLQAEVYNTLNEGQGGLPKSGPVPARSAAADASDHLPVFADVRLVESLGSP